MGLTNVEIMVPFVRTLGQAEKVIGLLAKYGLKRGENGLRVIMMCEVPSNAILAEQFLEYFDGFSIGSNDLTQLTLGLDRDSGMALLAADFDERDPAVKAMLSLAIKACREAGQVHRHLRPGAVGHPDFAAVAGGAGHRVDVAESGLGDRYLAEAGGARRAVGCGTGAQRRCHAAGAWAVHDTRSARQPPDRCGIR
jgi:signal transduction protein with GAF and PtsI domain